MPDICKNLARRLSGQRLLATTIVVAVAAAAWLIASLPASGQTPGGVIVFTSTRDGNQELYSAAPDGSGVKRLTKSSTPDEDPALSSDGRWIAYSSSMNGDPEIYVIAADGGSKPLRITHNTARDYEPAWSPDNQRIAFTSTRMVNEEIFAIGTTGSTRDKPVQLTRHKASDRQPDWSPDGRQIAFSSNRDGNFEIYAMNIDGSGVRQLTNSAGNNFNPSWSPDGRLIAFDSTRDKNSEIYLMNSDGSRQMRLTTTSSQESQPDWAPDGKAIIYTNDIGKNKEIFIVPGDGGASIQVTTNRSADYAPTWGEAALSLRPTAAPVVPSATATVVVPAITPTRTPTATPLPTATATPIAAPPATPTRTPTATTQPSTSQPPSTQQQLTVAGKMVEIGGPELPTQQDSDWQQIEGGQLRVDTATASGGNSGAFGATVLGQRYLTEVAMQGAMRDGNGVLRNGAGKFTVEIEGLPQSSQNVLRVDIEPLVFGIAPFSSGAGEAFQQYQPTGASAATMNLEIRRHDQSSQEVFQWWNETTESGGDRRLVTVDALDRNGQAARTWQFFDCFPISYSPFGEFAPGAMVSNEVLSLNCNRAEFDIAGSGPRRAMVQWLNGYSNGQDTRRDVSIVEMLHDGSEGATYFYGDSLPTMYRFPQFDATRSDNLMEEIHFVPATLLID